MLDHRAVEGLMEAIAPIIKSAIADATEKATVPLLERIAELEARKPEKGEPGEAGKSVTLDDVRPLLQEMVAAIPPAEPGKSVTVDDVRPLLAEMVDALPKPENGKSVTLDEVRPLLEEMVAAIPPAEPGKSVTLDDVQPLIAEAVAALPKPADGKSVTVDEVRPLLQEMVAALPPAAPGERGPEGEPGKPGEKGERGDAGRDASDLAVIMDIAGKQAVAALASALETYELSTPDGGRTIELKFVVDDTEISRALKTAIPLDKGVWREGQYEPGDGVTLGGHFWIAQENTSTKPAESKEWRLAVQRGRNGKDFRPDDRPKGDPVRLA